MAEQTIIERVAKAIGDHKMENCDSPLRDMLDISPNADFDRIFMDIARAAIEATDVERLRAALERLGSMEAFDHTRAVDKSRDTELLARINFARGALP